MATLTKAQKLVLRTNLAPERLRELLVYEPDTGLFRWRFSKGSNSAGSVAGTILSPTRDYLAIGIDHTRFLAHRLAWLYMTGEWPEEGIDHINGKRSDNRWVNLRCANQSQNAGNALPKSTNKSGFKGVHFDKRTGKWAVEITINYGKHWLGRYDNLEDAVRVYQLAAKTLFEEFAKSTTPDEKET